MSTTYQINFLDALAKSFGKSLIPLYHLPDTKNAENKARTITIGRADEQGHELWQAGDERGEGTSYLGLAVMQTISLATSAGDRLDLGDCIVTINLPRRIVKTPLQGVDGTTKEFINNDDYDISIKGLLVGRNPYKPPYEDMKRWNDFFVNNKEALAVSGKRFDTFGIHNLVIEHISWIQIVGSVNVQPFELRCISDVTHDIQIINQNPI